MKKIYQIKYKNIEQIINKSLKNIKNKKKHKIFTIYENNITNHKWKNMFFNS